MKIKYVVVKCNQANGRMAHTHNQNIALSEWKKYVAFVVSKWREDAVVYEVGMVCDVHTARVYLL